MRNVPPIEMSSRFSLASLPIMFNGRLQAPYVSEHKHEFDEIVLVTEGRGIHHTRFGMQQIETGDVLIIPEGETHAYSECSNMVIYNCMVSIRHIPLPLGTLYHHPAFVALFLGNQDQFNRQGGFPQLRLNEHDTRLAESILQRCNREVESRELGWSLNCFAGFLEYLTLLLRQYHLDDKAENLTDPKIETCLDYLNAHSTEPVSVQHLCKKLGLSESTLFRMFKRTTGMSVCNYQQMLRLSRAAHQLRTNPSATIGEIAHSCGFDDSNYFSRIFRNRFHCSPREYRMQKAPPIPPAPKH